MFKIEKKCSFIIILLFIFSLFTACEKSSISNFVNINSENEELMTEVERTYTYLENFLTELKSGERGRDFSDGDRELIIGELNKISIEYKNMLYVGDLSGDDIRDIKNGLDGVSAKTPIESYEANSVNRLKNDAVLIYEIKTGKKWEWWNFSETFLSSGYEDRGWDLVAETGSINWVYTSYGAKMSAYKSGEDSNIAWLISPTLFVESNSVMSFESAQAYPVSGTELKIMISTDYIGGVKSSNWVELNAVIATEATGNWTYISSGDVDLSAYQGEKINIGFKYIGSNTLSTAYEVKDLKIENAYIYSELEQVSSPEFSLGEGTYSESQSLSIRTATDGADIYYTLDGREPDINSNHYESAITVDSSITVKAIAVKDGMNPSDIVSASYIIQSENGTQWDAPETYYSSITDQTGIDLKAALNDIIDGNSQLTYDEAYDALEVTDQDPNNSADVVLLYTGWTMDGASQYDNGSGWNREHVWAKSHGDFGTEIGAGTDLHNLKPADVSVNSARGNKEFDNGGTQHSEATECYTDSDSWEARDSVKGDIARILFYMAVRYEGENGELDLELSEDINDAADAPTHGKLSTLLQWNEEDPVDDFERRRNHIIYTDYQHNRNPFIDHPEWVNSIWGN